MMIEQPGATLPLVTIFGPPGSALSYAIRDFLYRSDVPFAWVQLPNFDTTTRSFEFRAGGAWDFVMHGPDGTDYQEWITWTEIVPPERIALVHGESRDDPNAFASVLTFAPAGEETRVEMRTVFPTKELRDEAVEKYHAVEGGEQTLRNLAAYVGELG